MHALRLVGMLGNTRVAEDLSDALILVQNAVVENNAKGSVTLKITIEPDVREDGCPTVIFQGDVEFKAPRPARDPMRMYIHDGQASTRHPRQPVPRVPDGVPADFADNKSDAAGE